MQLFSADTTIFKKKIAKKNIKKTALKAWKFSVQQDSKIPQIIPVFNSITNAKQK